LTSESALVGYSGFVGGNLHRQHRFDAVYNSTNIGEIAGRSFELLVLSAVQAKRWWANLNPNEDWAGIERLLASLAHVKAQRVVLVSTIDVLGVFDGVDEDFDPSGYENHAYGAHRLRLERIVQAMFPKTSVVRLPSLFGPGLKKNVIYDLLNENQLEKIEPNSSFQYYDLANLWEHIGLTLREDISLIHLFPEPVTTARIIQQFFPELRVGSDPGFESQYACRTKYADLFGGSDGFIWSREEVCRKLGLYIESYRRGDIR